MIKKIIHYTWFSGEEFPEQVKICIDSWHKYLPDYEFKLWDLEAALSVDSVYLKEALSVKKWAFAADYIRLYALYNEGGIWLDTDVELRCNLDSFLDKRCFMGKERFYNISPTFGNVGLCRYITAHCFGSEAGHPYIKKCLDFYEGRHFIESGNTSLPNDLRYNMTIIPYVMARIALDYGYNWLPKAEDIQYLPEGITIYPSYYFDGSWEPKKCVAIHHHMGGWTEKIASTRTGDGGRSKLDFLRGAILRCLTKCLYKCNIVVFKLRK